MLQNNIFNMLNGIIYSRYMVVCFRCGGKFAHSSLIQFTDKENRDVISPLKLVVHSPFLPVNAFIK